jgi:hypothetical protein
MKIKFWSENINEETACKRCVEGYITSNGILEKEAVEEDNRLNPENGNVITYLPNYTVSHHRRKQSLLSPP